MRKLTYLLIALLVLAVALPAFAADKDDNGVNDIYQQILQLRKQLVDKYVENGELSAEQGQNMKEHLDAAEQYRQQNPEAFDEMIQGCGGMMGGANGYGMMGGGYGYGMMGGSSTQGAAYESPAGNSGRQL